MEKLSPKKYIQTKARSLPIYKCFVNENWQVTKLATVFVCRQHTTGHITWGNYLIDLLCLGVKDSWYNFNMPADEMTELFDNLKKENFIEIDYNLAHNIIFTGFDFATNIGLPPYKEFELTKYILEVDDDKIPIIDIEVGDENGVPHLMINDDGKESWAISILNKSIGEDGYYRTFVKHDEDSNEYDDEYTDNIYDASLARSLDLDDFELGEITALEAEMLTDEALHSVEAIKLRDNNEIVAIAIEFGIRQMEQANLIEKIDYDSFMATPSYLLYVNCEDSINSINGPIYLEEMMHANKIDSLFEKCGGLSNSKVKDMMEHIFYTYKNNFYALYKLFPLVIMDAEDYSFKQSVYIELNKFMDKYPLAELLLAYESIFNIPDLRFANIINSNSITECYPQYTTFGYDELIIYWLIKFYQSIKADDVQSCVFYYKLLTNLSTEGEFIITKAQLDLLKYIEQKSIQFL